MSYDNSKDVILRKVQSDNPKAPTLRVNFQVDGKKYSAGLWPWTKKDGSPVVDSNGNALYKGQWDYDTYGEQAAQQGLAQAQQNLAEDLDDDDIPF